MKRTGEMRICETCGNEFYVPGWVLRRGNGKYCNYKCNINLYKKGQVSKNKGKKHPGFTNSGSFKTGDMVGDKHPQWKGGIVKLGIGYVLEFNPNHPYSRFDGNYVLQHRLVMEEALGRYLLPEERVHHINFNKQDNRIENLMLFRNESEHQKYHQALKRQE